VSYHIAYGSVPHSLNVLHHCDNRICVNPLHFFIGTNEDNRHDCQEKGRARGAIGERNQGAKLTWEDVDEIRELHALGVMQKVLAERYGVWPTTIADITHWRKWTKCSI
jgi:hypothetical protein